MTGKKSKRTYLRRSWLLGILLDDKRLAKALASQADIVVLDLEDSAVPARRLDARKRLLEILGNERSMLGNRPVWVRINSLLTAFGMADLEALADHDVDGIMYPMVRGAEELWQVRRTLDATNSPAEINVILETPECFLNLNDIARVPGITELNHGPGDLTLLTGIAQTERASLDVTATMTVLAATSYGITPTEGIHTPLWRDSDAVLAYVRRAKNQGFKGMQCFYLPHAELINRVFTPTTEETDLALEQIHAYDLALAEGHAATVVRGVPVLRHQYEMAKTTLAQAEAIRAHQ